LTQLYFEGRWFAAINKRIRVIDTAQAGMEHSIGRKPEVENGHTRCGKAVEMRFEGIVQDDVSSIY